MQRGLAACPCCMPVVMSTRMGMLHFHAACPC
jgi:hypothetical protein